MTLESLAPALLVGSLIVLASVLGVRLAGRLGVPGLLLYLVLGMVLGTLFDAVHLNDAVLGSVLGYAALILILVQGGLTTRMQELRPVMWPSILLASVGVLASIAVVAGALVWLLDLPLQLAVLLGTVLAATDAAAVFSILRRLRLSPRLRTVLEGEAGFNDAPVVVLVSIASSGSFGSDPWWQIVIRIVTELVGGALVGVAVGYGARWLLPRLALPAVGLYPIAAMALLVGSYGLATVLHASGFMAVYLAAVLVGSAARLPHRRSIIGFADGMAWIAEIGLFVMLGLLADVARLPSALTIALVAGAALVVLARPVAAVVSLLPFRWSWREITFVGIAGLRGAVPIVFAAIPLGKAVPGAEVVFDATLIVVFILLLGHGPVLVAAARRLRLSDQTDVSELEVESAPLDGVGAVVLGVDVPEASGLVGVFVTELGLPQGSVVSLIVRRGEALAVDANSRIMAGDRLVIVSTESTRAATEQRLHLIGRGGRLASWVSVVRGRGTSGSSTHH